MHECIPGILPVSFSPERKKIPLPITSNCRRDIDNKLYPLNLESREWDPMSNVASIQLKIDIRNEKLIHQGHIKNLFLPGVGIEASNKWLTSGVRFYETERLRTSIQDTLFPTKN